MYICQDHWHELRNAIRERGLWGLVDPRGYQAARITEQELQGGPAPSPFDPLRATSVMISEQALVAFGSDLLAHNDCPLCEVEQNLGRGLSTDWIDVDADAVLQFCREQKMVSREEI